MSVADSLIEMANIAQSHGQAMYKQALHHAINMIEIDADLGLAQLKIELAELEKEEELSDGGI